MCNFISSKDNDEDRIMHSKSDNTEIMINDKADEVIEERFQSLILRYQIRVETAREVVILSLTVYLMKK